MTLKKLISQIHLWIGLIVGLLFFIIAISGAIFSWEHEISYIIYKRNVEPKNQPFVSYSALKKIMEKEFPEGDFRTVFYQDKSTAAEVLLYVPGTYYIAFLNPYSGELLHLQDMKQGWLNKVKMLHRNLLLGPIGREIVHWVTLLFFFMMITGLVLWWPPNKASRKQRFKMKWGVSPKRFNYDLHNVLGFYATWIVFFCVITGIFWGFDGVKNVLKSTTGETQKVYDQPVSEENDLTPSHDQFALLDSLTSKLLHEYPGKYIRISNPHGEKDPIRVSLVCPSRIVAHTDHLFFDKYSGNMLMGNFQNGKVGESSLYNSINHWVYDVHFGSALGFVGRLLVFLATLIFASLPITGFIVWWGRMKKK